MAKKEKIQKTNTQAGKTGMKKEEKQGLFSALWDSTEAIRERYKNDPQFREKVNKGGVNFLRKLKKKKEGDAEQVPAETEKPQNKKMLIYGGIGLLLLILLQTLLQ